MIKFISSIVVSVLLSPKTLPAQDNWTNQTPATYPLSYLGAMAYAGSDQVIHFGGLDENLNPVDATWVYDLSDNTWTLKTPTVKPSARVNHTMAYLGDDKVLLYGGDGAGTGTWVYDLSDNTWTLKNPVSNPSARSRPGMAWIGGDKVVLFGGAGSGTWVYDLSDNTWTLKNPTNEPPSPFSNEMASLGGDKVLAFSGNPGQHTFDTETWIYDLSDNNWTMQNSSPTAEPRTYHGVASLGNDKVLLFGGYGIFNNPVEGDTWVYDRSAALWTFVNPPTAPSERAGFAIAPIGNNKVLLVGGNGFGNALMETWLYTATAPSCSLTASAGDDEHLLFGYPPSQCKTKTAMVTDGTAPFSYSWTLNRALLPGESLTGNTTASVTVCLMDTAELCVTVTDAANCTATDCAMIFAEDVRCNTGNGQNQKVMVCHNGNIICVESAAVSAHTGHGDYIGQCPGSIQAQSGSRIEQLNKPGFVIYPNPAKDNFSINFDTYDGLTETRILRIIKTNGQVIKQVNVSHQTRLDIRIDQAGMYWVQLKTGKEIITKKLIIER